jgi:FAD/FMN-containing dehydrogenase
LLPWPAKRALLLLGYPDIARAADDVAELRPLSPDALEAFDGHVIENLKRKGRRVPGEGLLPQGSAWLLVEFGGGDQKEANDKAEKAFTTLQKTGTQACGMRLVEPAEEQKRIWQIRENGVGASHIPGVEDAWPSWKDAAVPPERLGDLFEGLRQAQ